MLNIISTWEVQIKTIPSHIYQKDKFKNIDEKTSGQDGGIGKHASCLLIQLQQKLQLDYKTCIIQNCQKSELYGSLMTKDLKKPQSSK